MKNKYFFSQKILTLTLIPPMKRNADQTSNRNVKRVKPELSFSERLLKLYELTNLANQYCATPNVNKEIASSLAEFSNIVPYIVVWGNESTGKSTFINKLLGTCSYTSQNIGTLCPIEYHRSTNAGIDKFEFTMNNTTCSFNTIAEAEQYVLKHSKTVMSGILRYTNYNQPKNLCIIDLPGVVVSEEQSQYYQQIKNMYLYKDQTIILHVLRADLDSVSNDHSQNYLADIDPKKIIKVLTHIDVWEHYPDKIYVDLKSDQQLLLFTSKGGEANIVAKYRDKIPASAIYGHYEISNYIAESLKQRMLEFSPVINRHLDYITKLIDLEFQTINRTQPNMRDVANQFKNDYIQRFTDLMNKGGNVLSKELNQIQNKISVQALEYISQKIPSIDELAKELASTNRRQFKGSEGWSDISTKYIELMLNELDDFVGKINQEYFEALVRHIQAFFKLNPNQMAIEILEKLSNESLTILKELENDNLKDMLKSINETRIAPYVYEENTGMDPYRKIVTRVGIIEALIYVDTLKNQINRKELGHEQTADIILDMMDAKYKNSSDNTHYYLNASIAYSQIHKFWTKISSTFCTEIITKLYNQELNFLSFVTDEIQNVESTDFVELESLSIIRDLLVKIEDLCLELK